MQRLQAFKFQLRPNGHQEKMARRFAGSSRFVYNRALALQKARHESGEKKLGYAGLCKELSAWKQDSQTQWLTHAPSQSLQQALKDLERAYANFFEGRAAPPAFKKRGWHDAFRFPQGVKLDQANARICLPKLGWIRYRKSREVLGTVKNVTVLASGGKWFVSIQTECEVETPRHPATSMVGVDLGVANLATLSTGEIIAPVNALAKRQRQLARAQRDLSRKRKFSRNWIKARARIRKIHTRVGNTRCDYLHKLTTTLSKNHAAVVIEDLQVRNMTRSASGTVDQPGQNVRAKSGLNRSILDQGWGELRRQLAYKQAWRGGIVETVEPRNTSRTCSACGHVAKENRPSQSRFECVVCGHTAHADVNAARNILAAGHAATACGGDVSPYRHLGVGMAAPAK
ncbi:RNA-guided endonuclease InsQ/TnpB family protein [Spiribacter vilamensis]|uniref:Putative transposase n=1 Tax=Spiribacter vilamensis TaxID=531306 RepID=A0A4Q8D1I2_9GAMM|nr:RNA-guided endonuclease TnpB family protein [Spiribacter vilamensis]RZU99117.1 putative transposase [Spiribacter vilamensis]TVO61887.1 IS200/IS605 family element transposase accessory protein TnpB [Spiribacter vilamensis]